jgi:hypothetical protein
MPKFKRGVFPPPLQGRVGEAGNRESVPLGPPHPTPLRKGEGSRTRAATARFICDGLAASTSPSLHVPFDRRDRFRLGILVAGDAALGDIGQFSLEIGLGESEVGH